MTHFLFVPGTNSYLPQLARYSDDVVFVDDTGTLQKIKHTNPYPFIKDNYTCVKFPEFDIDLPKRNQILGFLGHIGCKFKDYITYTDSKGLDFIPMMNRYCLGQNDDIKCVQDGYEKVDLDKKIIAFGVSRGVPAIINWYASSEQKPKINGFIFEGGPSTLANIVKYSTGINRYYYELIEKIAPYVTRYDPNGQNALEEVTKLPHDVPILFISSVNDYVVPWKTSFELYEKLCASGYTNVQFVLLEKSAHNGYIVDDPNDRQKYIDAITEFMSKI